MTVDPEIAIGLGIILSLFFTETLGVTAGGVIVPGYIALFLYEPGMVIGTFLISITTYLIIKIPAGVLTKGFPAVKLVKSFCLNTSKSTSVIILYSASDIKSLIIVEVKTVLLVSVYSLSFVVNSS